MWPFRKKKPNQPSPPQPKKEWIIEKIVVVDESDKSHEFTTKNDFGLTYLLMDSQIHIKQKTSYDDTWYKIYVLNKKVISVSPEWKEVTIQP